MPTWSSSAELLGEGIVKSIRDSSDSENGMNMNVGDVLYLVDNLNAISRDPQTTKRNNSPEEMTTE